MGKKLKNQVSLNPPDFVQLTFRKNKVQSHTIHR